jgi:hypothetical protein
MSLAEVAAHLIVRVPGLRVVHGLSVSIALAGLAGCTAWPSVPLPPHALAHSAPTRRPKPAVKLGARMPDCSSMSLRLTTLD